MKLSRFLERFALVGAWLALIFLFSLLLPDTFATWRSFSAMLSSQAVLVVVTMALIIPMTTGDYDLSVVGTLSLSQMVVGVLSVRYGWDLGPILLVCLSMGLLVGLVNGALTVGLKVDSFIVSLGVGTLLSGIVLLISGAETISGLPPALSRWVAAKRLFGVPLGFYYGLLMVLGLWYVTEFTALGRRMIFVGQNREVSRLSGLRVGRVRIGAFVASGVISAVAGLMYGGTTGASDPTSGASFLLPAFAAAFLGATAIYPGRFNAIGSFIAVYFLVTGITGLTLLGAQSWVQNVFYGGGLVTAVTLSQLAKERRERVRVKAS
jgi:ribose transport system permease protein